MAIFQIIIFDIIKGQGIFYSHCINACALRTPVCNKHVFFSTVDDLLVYQKSITDRVIPCLKSVLSSVIEKNITNQKANITTQPP